MPRRKNRPRKVQKNDNSKKDNSKKMAATTKTQQSPQVATVITKQLRVDNIGQFSTKTLADMFGLTKTPYLQTNSSVKIHVEDTGNHAIITVPVEISDDFLKLNGVEFEGQIISVRDADATAGSSNDAASSSTSNENSTDECNEFFLRFALVAKPFGLPSDAEVANAAVEHFNDTDIKFRVRRMGPERIYRFVLKKKVPNMQKLKLICNGTEHSFPLLTQDPFARKKEKERGILLTMKEAYEGPLENLPGSTFDEAIKHFNLQIIVPTQLQRTPGAPTFSGNRYCVIQIPANTNSIPEYLPITHPITKKLYNLKLTYKGQERFCTRCMKKHCGQCPELKKFYETIEQRKQMAENGDIFTKMFSDSTLRLVDPLGLTAECCTMSGGGIGQVAQAMVDDPETVDKSVLVIMSGANDLKSESFESNKEFAENVDQSVKKLVDAATSNPNKQIVLINSHPDQIIETHPAQHPVSISVRQKYMHKKIEQISAGHENLHVIDIHYETDETGHPSLLGTEQILAKINEHASGELIWNPRYTTSDRMYQRVETIYRYGCNHCGRFGTEIAHEYRNNLLCDDCHLRNKENASKNDYPLLADIITEMEEIFNNDFTALNTASEEEDDLPPKKQKTNVDDQGNPMETS